MNIFEYAGSIEQVAHLRSMCEVWQKAGFWDFDSVNEALATTGTILTYAATGEAADRWDAACLFRSIESTAELLYIFVRPESRGQGLADEILGDMVLRLRKARCERLLLEVRPTNHPAIQLYESIGMRQIAIRKRYYQNGDDALIYQLELT